VGIEAAVAAVSRVIGEARPLWQGNRWHHPLALLRRWWPQRVRCLTSPKPAEKAGQLSLSKQ